MPIRGFTTPLLTAMAALAVGIVLLVAPAGESSATSSPIAALSPAFVPAVGGTDDPPPPTLNDFYPEARPLGDCLNNSIPLPNCGSEARGGWAQTAVFVAILAGLAFIAWRIVASSRRARVSRTPDATTAPGGDGGAPAP